MAADIADQLAEFAADKAAPLDRLAHQKAATDAAIAETIDEAHEKLAADKHAQAEASERAAETSAKAIATARGKGNGAKADVEKARDDALSTANQAHAQAGEKLGQLDAALGDSDDQIVKLKEKDSEDSHDEILDREKVWKEYRTELLAAPEEAEQDLAAALDKLQLGLDVMGLIPFAGNLCDLANVAISLYRERYFEAGLRYSS